MRDASVTTMASNADVAPVYLRLARDAQRRRDGKVDREQRSWLTHADFYSALRICGLRLGSQEVRARREKSAVPLRFQNAFSSKKNVVSSDTWSNIRFENVFFLRKKRFESGYCFRYRSEGSGGALLREDGSGYYLHRRYVMK